MNAIKDLQDYRIILFMTLKLLEKIAKYPNMRMFINKTT